MHRGNSVYQKRINKNQKINNNISNVIKNSESQETGTTLSCRAVSVVLVRGLIEFN